MTMTPARVEHALSMMRMYLLERATESEWAENHIQELSRTIVTCLGERPGNTNRDAPPSEAIPGSEVLRQAIRFVNQNLDSRLRWDDIAAALGVDPFTFGRVSNWQPGSPLINTSFAAASDRR